MSNEAEDAEREELLKEITQIDLEWCYPNDPLRYDSATHIADFIIERDKSQRQKLLAEIEGKINEKIDGFSIHQPQGRPKGTLARRVLKSQIHKVIVALHGVQY